MDDNREALTNFINRQNRK